MRFLRSTNADEYLLSFWTRQQRKDCEFPPPDKMKEVLLNKYPYKFPFEGKREAAWEIREISTVADLEKLWMHKSDTWLEDRGLWRSSHLLRDLAKTAIEIGFFKDDRNRDTGQYKNYNRWKRVGFRGQLDGHEKPLLVQHDGCLDIIDGFGRLLPYLALVYEGAEFYPLETYFAH